MWCRRNFEVKKKTYQIAIFSRYVFERFFLKSSFSIENPILKINDYDLFNSRFMQGYHPLQS